MDDLLGLVVIPDFTGESLSGRTLAPGMGFLLEIRPDIREGEKSKCNSSRKSSLSQSGKFLRGSIFVYQLTTKIIQ